MLADAYKAKYKKLLMLKTRCVRLMLLIFMRSVSMPRYSHNPVTGLIEKTKTIGASGLSKPSPSHSIHRVAFPFDPLSPDGQLVSAQDAINSYFYKDSASDLEGEIESVEYDSIAKQGTGKTSSIGIQNSFVSPPSYTKQRMHDCKSDSDNVYILWSGFFNTAYRLLVSKFLKNGLLSGTSEVASHSTTPFYQERTQDWAESQTRYARLSVPSAPHSYLYVLRCLNDAAGGVPGFTAGGTDNGLTLHRFNKGDLLAPGGTDQWDIVPTDLGYILKEAELTCHESSNTLHVGYLRRETGGSNRDVVGYGSFNYGTSTLTAGVNTKTLVSPDTASHVKALQVGALGTRIWWSEYDQSVGASEIKASDDDGGNENVIALQGVNSIPDGIPFEVIGSPLNDNFHCFYFRENNLASVTEVILKVCNSDGTGGGIKLLHSSTGRHTGNIYASLTKVDTRIDGWVTWSDHDIVAPPEHVYFENLQLSTDVADKLEYRKPPISPPQARAYFPCFFEGRGHGVIAGSTANVLDGEIYTSWPSYSAIVFKMNGGNNWHRSADNLYVNAMGGASLEYEIHPQSNRGIRLMPHVGTWTEGLGSRGFGSSGRKGLGEGIGISAEIPGTIFTAGPDDYGYFMLLSNSRGDVFDPSQLDISYIGLNIDPEEESVIGTVPMNPPPLSPPHSIVVQTGLRRFDDKSYHDEYEIGAYSPAPARYAVRGPATDFISKLDVSNNVTSSITVTEDSLLIISIDGIAVDPIDGQFFIIAETDKFGPSESVLMKVNPASGDAKLIGPLGDKFSDIVFHSSGVLYGVSHETGISPEDVFEIGKEDASIVFKVSAGSGTGHVLGFNPDDGLLYHVYDSPVKMQSINPGTLAIGTITVTQPGTPPDPAIVSPISIVWNGSSFTVQSDPAAKNTYTMTTSGVTVFTSVVNGEYYGMANVPLSLPAIDVTGISGNTIAAQAFFTASFESVLASSVELLLSKQGNPVDLYHVLIVRLHSVQGGSDNPETAEVFSTGVINGSSIPAGPASLVSVPLLQLKPMLPGTTYAVMLTRGESQNTFWTARSQGIFELYETVHETSDIVKSTDLDIDSETINQIDGIAIDPTSGTMYAVGLSSIDPLRSFLGTVDKDTGNISIIGVFPDVSINDITFDIAGQMYGVTWHDSPSLPNTAGTIDKALATYASITAIGGSTLSRGCAFDNDDGFLYHIHGTGPFERINLFIPTVTDLVQFGDLLQLGTNIRSFVHHPGPGLFIGYFDGGRKILSNTGTWSNYPRSNKTPYDIHGSAFDVDGSPGGDDSVNYISWHKGNAPIDKTLTYQTKIKKANGWSNRLGALAFKVSTRHYNKVTVEASRDDGITWTEVPLSIISRFQLLEWNGHPFVHQELGGTQSLENQPNGSAMRLRYKLKGLYQEIHSISYFPK